MTPTARRREEIAAYLLSAIAAELRVPPERIDADRPLTFYGLDSLTAAILAGDLAEWLGHPLPDDLHLARATVNSLADRLATAPQPAPVAPTRSRASDRHDYSTMDYSRIPRGERWIRRLASLVVRVISDVHMEGRDGVPESGPLLFATNHLHILDALWMTVALPRRTIFLTAEEFERKPVVGWLLNRVRVIYIARGTADLHALDRVLDVLRSGGAVGVAPEGRLSRTGGLIKGQVGIAYLASQSGAPIIPVAAWGQERAGRSWLTFRRVRVEIRFGPPVSVPVGLSGALELERETTRIMTELARLLPPRYRGLYPVPQPE